MSSFRVVASVGTYHHPFNRFVTWIEPWLIENKAKVVFQHGSTRPIEGAENHEMLAPAALLSKYRKADAIVLQGGAGGVMDARKAGRVPIVVPRIPVDDEVVDDHQVVLSRRLAELGVVHAAETQAELERLLDGMRAGTVSSRVSSKAPSPGVAEAVRLLSAEPVSGAPGGVTVPLDRPGIAPHMLAARAQRPRRTIASVVTGWVQQGLPGYLLSLMVGVIVLGASPVEPVLAAGTAAGIGLWLAYSFAALPTYERSRSLVPSVRMVALLGITATGGVLLGVGPTTEHRLAVGAGLAAASTLAATTLLSRRTFRRTPTVLVGEERRVRPLAARWAGRDDVSVVASCVWRPGAENLPASANGSLARVVPEVLAAVNRNRARSVAIVSDRPMSSPALRHLVSAMAKALLDRGAALLGLVVLSPLLLLIGLLVRLTSWGPALFRQTRTGRDGNPFTMIKFRTMVVDAEERLADLAVYNEGSGPLFKLANDPRITRLGRFLRRTSLDELPQLINVLRGEMSLVGPRPALPAETAEYSDWVWRRLHVRPGLTGLWQVSGRSRLSWEDSIRVDLQYVNTWNLRLDAKILLKTVGAVLRRDGAL